MSTLEVNKITPVSGGTTVQVGESGDTINIPAGATIANAGTSSGFGDSLRPNAQALIINGSMEVSQRGTSFTSNGYQLDRWTFDESTDGAVTVTQDSTVPSGQGFGKSIKFDVTTADGTLAANQYCQWTQFFEGQNLQLLKYGTSSAENLTLAFWVRSNKTGTYCMRFVKEAGGQTRYECPIEYSISSADTWEKKIINLSPTAGSTTFITNSAGAIVNSNASGYRIAWILASGADFNSGTNNTWTATSDRLGTTNQVNFLDNTSNELYITGIQLEVGEYTSATIPPFQHESYGNNLNRCERYYQVVGSGTRADNLMYFYAYNFDGTSTMFGTYNFRKEMRAAPSLDQTSGTDYYTFKCNNAGDNFDGVNGFRGGIAGGEFYLSGGSSVANSSAGMAGAVLGKNASSHMALVAEL